MGRHILMTTMSTLNRTDRVHYYYSTDTEGEIPLFCDGISAVEDGSKYILSQYPIDEILVVGSSETISGEELKNSQKTNIENLADNHLWDDLYKEWENGERMSAYAFYTMRIVEFILQKDDISKVVVESVSEEKRREQIEQIALEEIKDIADEEGVDTGKYDGDTSCMLLLEKSRELVKNLREKIANDIETSFLEEEGYLRYIQRGEELVARYIEIDAKSQEYYKIREDIEKDASLSILEREFLLVSLSRKMDALFYEKQKIDVEIETEELRGENAHLQYQIQTLKNQRLEKELAYAQYVIYRNLDSKHIMGLFDSAKKISMRFVSEKVSEGDNIAGIVNEIYGVTEGEKKDGEEINVYIDMQGGSRTSGYVRNAVLSILNNQNTNNIQIRRIIATDFNPQNAYVSKIVDETKRYRIHDLVSGMNAFIRYGKADMLIKYCDDMDEEKESRVRELVDKMKAIDDAISLCDPQALSKGIENLSEQLNKKQDEKEKSYVSNVFRVLEDGIRRDYGGLLAEDIDYLELVDWCCRKGLIQQALTIIEDKLPAVIMEKLIKVTVWRKGNTESRDMEPRDLSEALAYSSFWEKRKENILFYGLPRKIENWKKEFCSVAFEEVCTVYLSEKYPVQDKKEMTERILNNFFHIKKDKLDDNEKIGSITKAIGMCDPKVKKLRKSYDKKFHQLQVGLWHHMVETYIGQKGIGTPLNLEECIENNSLNENDVKNEKENLEKYKGGEEFVAAYCRFREMSDAYERGRKEKDLFSDADIYLALGLSREKYKLQMNDSEHAPFRTLAGLKENVEYEILYEDKNQREKTMVLKAELPNLQDLAKRQELEKLLLLHAALKSERNNSNHASDKETRLPLQIVEMAILEYIKLFRSLVSEGEKHGQSGN